MLHVWQKYKTPPIWFWFITLSISIALIFFLGLKTEYLFYYWIYVVIYNLSIIIIAIFYLVRFLLLITYNKKRRVIGTKFTLNLLRVIPILTILPIASFYIFSFSTVQDNIQIASSGFSNLNQKILEEVDNITLDLNSFRAQRYLDLSADILRVTDSTIENNKKYKESLTNTLNYLVRNNRLCKAAIIFTNDRIVSNSKNLCADFDINNDLASNYNIIDKNSNVLVVKLAMNDIVETEKDITLIAYFMKNNELTKVFNRIGIFKQGIENAKINITNNILTKQFLVDFLTTILLTVISMVIIVAKMLENLMVPLNNITVASRKISKGNYGVMAPKTVKDDDMNVLITEFNEMSKQIQESRIGIDTKNIYLETIIKYSIGIIAFDNKYRINLINNQAVELLNINDGVVIEDFIGKSHHTLKIDFLDGILNYFNNTAKFHNIIEFNQLLLEVTGATLTNNNQKLGYILLIKDISEISKNQKLLAWREVARRMAHEVKNPLNPILLSAERLRNKFLDKDDTKIIDKTTNTIINQVKSINNIISSFAKFEQPSIDYKIQSLNKIIEYVMRLYEDCHIKFDAAIIPDLKLDNESIARVLINIIKNSIEAKNDNDKLIIDIKTKEVNNEVWLTISDNGPGFDKKIVDKVFEPYATNKKYGTGLGMSIVANTLAKHNASIMVDKDYHEGAKFIIKFQKQLA